MTDFILRNGIYLSHLACIQDKSDTSAKCWSAKLMKDWKLLMKISSVSNLIRSHGTYLCTLTEY